MKFSRRVCALSLMCLISTSCYTVEHFPEDASRYDDLFFAPVAEAPATPSVKEDKWRNYAVFGLVEWKEDQIKWAGTRLGAVGEKQRPMKVVVHTEQSFLNGATSFGLSLIGGILAPLLFVPRTTEVIGWTPEG